MRRSIIVTRNQQATLEQLRHALNYKHEIKAASLNELSVRFGISRTLLKRIQSGQFPDYIMKEWPPSKRKLAIDTLNWSC
jgi:hypothetical protein